MAKTKRTPGGGTSLYDGRVPRAEGWLRGVVRHLTGVEIARRKVCRGHHAPWEYFRDLYLDPPALALVLGPRGGGKSFLSALDTHLRSRSTPGFGTRILGGSRAQSAQVHEALRDLVVRGLDGDAVEKLTKEGATYANGSEVSILSASSTSVRGPHVPSLKLDEVDEIAPEIREAAMGMCMNRRGARASVVMTSTWHRVGGPMSELMDRAHAGEFPMYHFCTFDVLERCPEERSGPDLEKCPACPLMPWCHEDRDLDPLGRPKAKRAGGHYGIDALIQKVQATSLRTFEADYLCKGPKADGLWFPGFDEAQGVDAERAEYDPALPVHVAVDPGVFTGAVFYQLARAPGAAGPAEEVRVFADYLAEDVPAEQNAQAIVELARVRCQGRMDAVWYDPAGGSKTPIGPTVLGEFERGGLRGMRPWPRGRVADGLALVESFVQPADGRTRLLLHPRCKATLQAVRHYRRAKRGGQWQDYPEDPQHPHEDLMDALRGGLRALFPEGRRPQAEMRRVPARRVF
jgi:hypothetical protein